VTPLFRKSEEKAAREEAGRVEFEHLMALPVAELARDLMPAFGPDGLKLLHGPAWGINLLQLAGWVGRTYCPSGAVHARELMEPVREALQTLENAGLVLPTPRHRDSWTVTRLGETALADGTVPDHLVGQPRP
jgi:hypothetical protein